MVVRRLVSLSLILQSCLVGQSPAFAQASAETAQACAETENVLQGLQREEKEKKAPIRQLWAIRHRAEFDRLRAGLAAAVAANQVFPGYDRLSRVMRAPVDGAQLPGLVLFNQKGFLLPLVDEVAATIEGAGSAGDFEPEGGAADKELEYDLQRTQYQLGLREQRKRDLDCAALFPPGTDPASLPRFNRDPAPPIAPRGKEPNTATVCAETRRILAANRASDVYLFRWAADDGYHNVYFAQVTLRDAIKENRYDNNFAEIAPVFGYDVEKMGLKERFDAQPELLRRVQELDRRVRAYTGRPPEDEFKTGILTGLGDAFGDQADEKPRSSASPETIRREEEIEERFLSLATQDQIREKRLKDLNCDSLPKVATEGDRGGSLVRSSTLLQENRRKEYYNGAAYDDYSFTENGARFDQLNGPNDKRTLTWTWDGVPGSLDPGQEVKIRIAGSLSTTPAGAVSGANYSAFVEVSGVDMIRSRNAYFYQGQHADGEYVFKVPDNATRVVIELSADGGIGHIVRHCYGDCGR